MFPFFSHLRLAIKKTKTNSENFTLELNKCIIQEMVLYSEFTICISNCFLYSDTECNIQGKPNMFTLW